MLNRSDLHKRKREIIGITLCSLLIQSVLCLWWYSGIHAGTGPLEGLVTGLGYVLALSCILAHFFAAVLFRRHKFRWVPLLATLIFWMLLVYGPCLYAWVRGGY